MAKIHEKGCVVGVVEELRRILDADVKELGMRLLKEHTQCDRRNFVRAVFAYIEGSTFALKHYMLDKVKENELTPAEMAMLREETYYMGAKGEVSTKPQYPPTDGNILFTLRVFMKWNGLELQADLGDGGWEALKRGLKVRHRITHPKDPASLVITDDEIQDVIKAEHWHLATSTANFMLYQIKKHGKEQLIEKLASVLQKNEVDEGEQNPDAGG